MKRLKISDTFTLDHYPSKQEIIDINYLVIEFKTDTIRFDILLLYNEKCECINIMSYNEMSKQQYDAFNKIVL